MESLPPETANRSFPEEIPDFSKDCEIESFSSTDMGWILPAGRNS